MKLTIKLAVIAITSLLVTNTFASDYLSQAYEKQVAPLKNKYIHARYKENRNDIGHYFRPWQTSNYSVTGEITFNKQFVHQFDSITATQSGRIYLSEIKSDNEKFITTDLKTNKSVAIDSKNIDTKVLDLARYQPTAILEYFYNLRDELKLTEEPDFAIYQTNIGKDVVGIYINKSNSLLDRIGIMSDQYPGFGSALGDIRNIYYYHDYTLFNDTWIAKEIEVHKANGKAIDEITLSDIEVVKSKFPKLAFPKDYTTSKDDEILPEVETIRYSNRLHFVDLKHEQTMSAVVEFADFLVVLEAPKSSENGELIITEARKIAPNKPIKYFVGGHFHPHYTGGMRAFVHKGATVISDEGNKAYFEELIKAPHTMNPDSLQIEPKPFKFEAIDSIRTISDGEYELQILKIGDKSDHTYDYLIFYFPHEKILYQGDLMWLPKTKEKTNISQREIGLYDAVKSFNLEPERSIQAWPTNSEFKHDAPFSEFEEAVIRLRGK